MKAPRQAIKSCLQMSLPVGALSMALAIVAAHAESPGVLPDNSYAICRNQTYALCAEASSFVFNNLAYAECQIEHGNSISAPPFNYPVVNPLGQPQQNICTLNGQGVGNGFMASTFSLPTDALKGGTGAVYTCPAGSTGAYAQCEGGICFKSTSGKSFPGFPLLKQNEIICSCPITKAINNGDPFGYQIFGPYPCQQDYFKNCTAVTNELNGTIIPVGAPTGAARILTITLTGTNPQVNECFQ
ncbi:MAG: hypothetical protein M3Z96_11295 [Pseudomonadota bacterium]|nr:hypothetical protein [Pseudomonadota bacterium]